MASLGPSKTRHPEQWTDSIIFYSREQLYGSTLVLFTSYIKIQFDATGQCRGLLLPRPIIWSAPLAPILAHDVPPISFMDRSYSVASRNGSHQRKLLFLKTFISEKTIARNGCHIGPKRGMLSSIMPRDPLKFWASSCGGNGQSWGSLGYAQIVGAAAKGVSVERIETAPKSRIWAPPLRGGPAPPKPEGIPPHPKGGQRYAMLHVKNPLSRAFFSIVALEESSFSHILPNLA